MDQLIEFFTKNYILLIGLIIVVLMIVLNEIKILKTSGSSITSKQAVLLYNKEEAVFFDMRSIADFNNGHIPGAVNTPETTVEDKIKSLQKYKDKPVIVYCANGNTTGKFCKILRENEFTNILNLKGGITAWKEDNLPLEK